MNRDVSEAWLLHLPTTMRNELATGTRVGDYVIERDLGDAYEAVHVVLPRHVRLEITEKAVAVSMMREACILDALHHPGVPRIFEVGLMRTNRTWVASELVEGEPITGPLSAIDVLELVRDVAEVLAHAHARGVVHAGLRADSIVRADRIVITRWSEARADSSDVARAADILALGTIALALLPTSVPARIKMMIDDLLVANALNRPSAAEVRARAKLILETMDEDDIVEEQVELIELEPANVPPPIPLRPSTPRLRWTPALGVQTPPKPLQLLPSLVKQRRD